MEGQALYDQVRTALSESARVRESVSDLVSSTSMACDDMATQLAEMQRMYDENNNLAFGGVVLSQMFESYVSGSTVPSLTGLSIWKKASIADLRMWYPFAAFTKSSHTKNIRDRLAGTGDEKDRAFVDVCDMYVAHLVALRE